MLLTTLRALTQQTATCHTQEAAIHHILTRSNTSLSLVLSEFKGPYCARRNSPRSSPSTRPSALAGSIITGSLQSRDANGLMTCLVVKESAGDAHCTHAGLYSTAYTLFHEDCSGAGQAVLVKNRFSTTQLIAMKDRACAYPVPVQLST